MNRIRILPLALLAGCASLPAIEAPDADEHLALGLQALDRQEFPAAYTHLSWVATNHGDDDDGRQALLAMAAVELDPRNPGRRLDVGAELAARHLQLPDVATWSIPVSQTLYLLAHELGAAEERAARAEAEKAMAESDAARAERERQQAAQQAQAAQAQVRRAEARAREAESAAARARAQARTARATRTLPTLDTPSVSARMGELRGERDRLGEEVESLRRRLAEREAELERIRKTLDSGA